MMANDRTTQMAAELRNSRIKEHPYQPQPFSNPRLTETLELDLRADLFAPGAQCWGFLATTHQKNLSADAEALIENFLALVETAERLKNKCPSTTIVDVKLYYIAVMKPEMYAKMMMAKPKSQRTPKHMYEKNFAYHLLRATVTHSREPNEPWAHTFGNLQKAINSQISRINLKEEKKNNRRNEEKKQGGRRKKRRRRDDDEEDEEEKEEDPDETPPETQESKWQKFCQFGIWERSDLPVFENPPLKWKLPPKYVFVHQATENKYKQMVDKYFHAKESQDEYLDINDPLSSYNPVNVFSPRLNFLKRQRSLWQHPLYADIDEKYFVVPRSNNSEVDVQVLLRNKQKRLRRRIQEELCGELCILLDGHGPLRAPGAHPDDWSAFRSEAIVGYPACYGGELCWLLDQEDFRADTWKHRKFPWADKTTQDDVREKRMFVKSIPYISDSLPSYLMPGGFQLSRDLLSDGEQALMLRVAPTKEDAEALYDHQVNMLPTSGLGSMSIKQWGQRNEQRKADMEAALAKEMSRREWSSVDSHQIRRKFRTQTQLDCIDEFASKVHSSEVSASMARRSIAKWYNDNVSRTEEEDQGKPFLMSCPHDKQRDNLSVFGDAMCRELKELEELCFMSQNHDLVVAKLIAILQVHVPFRTFKGGPRVCGIHPSFILESPNGSTGKSFTDDLTKMHMIPGTYTDITHITPQFLTGTDAPPDEDNYIQTYHKMIFFQDELQPGLLELKNPSDHRQPNQSSNHAEMIRTVQTNGEYHWRGPILDSAKNSAVRQNGSIDVRCECELHVCTNQSLSKFAHNGLSRNIVRHAAQFDNDNEDDPIRPDVTAKMEAAAKLTMANSEILRRRYQRWHRNQLIASIDGQMVEGCVPGYGPIDTSCADRFYSWVRRSAKDHGLATMSAGRNLDLFRALCQGLVLFEMSHRMFDVVGAPFAKRPWSFHDILWAQKHRVATVEHAVFAFGIMRNSFENGDLLNTTKLIYEWAFQVHTAHCNRLRAKGIDLDEEGERRYRDEREEKRGIVYQPGLAPEPNVFVKDKIMSKSNNSAVNAYHVDWVIQNPEVFGQAAHASVDTLIKTLAAMLEAFKKNCSWAHQLTEASIAQSLTTLMRTPSRVPLWIDGGPGTRPMPAPEDMVSTQILRVDAKKIVLACFEPSILAQRSKIQASHANLMAALQGVLLHPFCKITRDFLYGANVPDLPHVYDVISVNKNSSSYQRILGSPLMVDNNGVEEPLLGEIDDWFIKQFNVKIDIGPYMLRCYPSNNPVELMHQVYFFELPPYRIKPPHPTHEPLFFPQQFRERRKLQQKMTARRKEMLLLEAPSVVSVDVITSTLAAQERDLEHMVEQRIVEHTKQKRELDAISSGRTGLTNKMSTFLDKKESTSTFDGIALSWLQEWSEHTQSLRPLLTILARPKKKERKSRNVTNEQISYPLPTALQHPLTTWELSSNDNSKILLQSFNSHYTKHVKTRSDVQVDQRTGVLNIDAVLWSVHGGHLQRYDALDEYDAERKEDDEEDDEWNHLYDSLQLGDAGNVPLDVVG